MAGGYEVVTSYDQQGFPVVITQPIAEATAAKHYDGNGFLITTGAALASRSSPTSVAENGASSAVEAAAATVSSAPPKISQVSAAPGAATGLQEFGLLVSAVCSILSGVLFL